MTGIDSCQNRSCSAWQQLWNCSGQSDTGVVILSGALASTCRAICQVSACQSHQLTHSSPMLMPNSRCALIIRVHPLEQHELHSCWKIRAGTAPLALLLQHFLAQMSTAALLVCICMPGQAMLTGVSGVAANRVSLTNYLEVSCCRSEVTCLSTGW